MFGEVAEPHLFHQALGETLFDGEGIVLRPFVLAVVVDLIFVCGRGIVLVDFGEGDVARRFVVLALLGRIVKHRILFQFLADTLLQFLDRQLDELDGLDLQRREFLLLLEGEFLLDHRAIGRQGV